MIMMYIDNVYRYWRCVMATRIQIVMDEVERDRFRQAASREGLSLSDWIRQAARSRLESSRRPAIESIEDLRRFFAECDDREHGAEPDWHEHRAVIDRSRAAGRSST
jgi:hypothetical protein